MSFGEAVVALAVSCFFLGFISGFSAKYFWNKYCIYTEDGINDIRCVENED